MADKAQYIEDLRESLRDPEYAAEYLNAVLDDDAEGMEAVFLLSLRDVAEAVHMRSVADEAGVNRENLYRMLSPKGNPRFTSLIAVLKALGLRLSIATTAKYGNCTEEAAHERCDTRFAEPIPYKPQSRMAFSSDHEELVLPSFVNGSAEFSYSA